jgi:hypothetical protein
MKLPADKAGLPGNEYLMTGSALTPLRESIAALPAYEAEHPADLPVAEGSELLQTFFFNKMSVMSLRLDSCV